MLGCEGDMTGFNFLASCNFSANAASFIIYSLSVQTCAANNRSPEIQRTTTQISANPLLSSCTSLDLTIRQAAMPPLKRETQTPASGSDKKRARMRDARTISIQAPLGRTGGSASSGMFAILSARPEWEGRPKLSLRFFLNGLGNIGLPAAIDVEKFAQVRD